MDVLPVSDCVYRNGDALIWLVTVIFKTGLPLLGFVRHRDLRARMFFGQSVSHGVDEAILLPAVSMIGLGWVGS
jgi:hypothetical protein